MSYTAWVESVPMRRRGPASTCSTVTCAGSSASVSSTATRAAVTRRPRDRSRLGGSLGTKRPYHDLESLKEQSGSGIGGGSRECVRSSAAGTRRDVSETRAEREFEVECPHCHKSFVAGPIRGGRAARYRGFKCPHCRLFVPLERAADRALLEPLSRDSDA